MLEKKDLYFMIAKLTIATQEYTQGGYWHEDRYREHGIELNQEINSYVLAY